MGEILHASDLRQRLREKMKEEREEIDAVRKSELQMFSDGLRECASDVLRTTSSDIKSEAETISRDLLDPLRKLRNGLLRPLFVGLVIGISLLATICGGSWGALHLISQRFQSEMHQKSALAQEISRQQQTLRLLQARTWGVTLYQDNTGTRWIILPDRVHAKMLTRGARSAIELGR